MTVTVPSLPVTLARSSPLLRVDGDAVGLAVAGAAGGAGEVEVDLVDVGAGEVVDGDGVGAAEGVEVDLFDAGGVHGDVGGVAEEAEPFAVGGQVDVLGDCCAVEAEGVGAVLAFDGVAAVAGVPDEGVVADAELGGVVAAVAVDRVVAVTTGQRVDAFTAGDPVVARTAVDAQGDRLCREVDGRDRVVAAEAVDGELVRRVLVVDRDRRRRARHGHARGVPATSILSSPLWR